jgi:hypothetical protein
MRLRPGLLALALCFAQTALAQKVVVLEFEGDKGAKLHGQVEGALKKAKVVDLVAIKAWKDAAAKKKLKGAQAMTPSAVARVSQSVSIDAAVEGALGETFFVRILDPEGNELWSKDLPLKKGLISEDHAKKLAKAIAAAAKAGPVAKPEKKPKEPAAEEATEEAEPEKPKKKKKPAEEESSEGSSESTEEGDAPRRPAGGSSDSDRRRAEEEAEAQAAMRSQAEPEKDRDLETEGVKKTYPVRPKLVWIWLAGTTTGRSYCSRPGVATCAEYDALPENERPTGDTVEFSPNVPYAGFVVGAEIFPLATLWEKMGGFGFGLVGDFALGFSLTNVKIQLPTGATDEQQVVSTDRKWSGQFAARWHFSLGNFQYRGVSYIGLRAGLGGRTFEIDAAANVPLPGPDRFFGQFGADLYFQPVKWAGLKFSVTLYSGAKPGATVLVGYSKCTTQADGTCTESPPDGGSESGGFAIEGGLAGELIGPLGYQLMLRYENFTDRFYGQGKKWTTPCDTGRCGGADQEQYFQFLWGLTGSF